MAGWNPRQEMGILSYYLKFKLRRWTPVGSLPGWVKDSRPTYTEGRLLMYEAPGKPIHEKQVWLGKSLKYMLKWDAKAQHDAYIVGAYAKIK